MAVAISAQIPPSTISAPPDVASVPADATKTASGLATRALTPGTGKDHPTKDEIVVVNYTGWTAEGRMVDGSADTKCVAVFRLPLVRPRYLDPWFCRRSAISRQDVQTMKNSTND